MVNSLIVQLSANISSLGTTSSSVPEGVGQDGPQAQAVNFTDLLQAIVSGLDKGLGNLQDGTIVGADGKTVSSDTMMELMQKLSNGKGIGADKKTASGNSVTDVLQQMITQLQASFAQPVISVAPYKSGNTSSPDTSSIAATGIDGGNGTGALIAALEIAVQKGGVKKQSVINAPELAVAGSAAGRQLNMDPVPLMQSTGVTDQNAPVAAPGNAQTNSANLELGAFGAAVQKNLTNNTELPYQNTSTPNTANASTLNIANTSTLNTASAATLNIANAATLNTGSVATLNTASAATLNSANAPALNTANTSRLTTTYASRLNTVNASTPNTAGDPAQNTANASMLNSERGALNSLTEGTTGDLGIKEVSLPLNNGNKSMSGDTNSNTAFSPVTFQQTHFANDSQPAQETVPLNKLNELSEPILKTLGSGDKNLVIKLSPPDMGTIEIKLKMENGVLTADFKVDSTAVKDLFSVAMPQIKNSIESAGIKTGNFFTDLKDDRSSDSGRQQDTNQQQQRQQRGQKQSFFDFFA